MSSSKCSWILDSVTTEHICLNLECFVDYALVNDLDMHITILDGSKIPVFHKETMILINIITLKDVLHVPDFHFFLISVSKLCKDLHCQMIFFLKIYKSILRMNYLCFLVIWVIYSILFLLSNCWMYIYHATLCL